MCTYIGCTYTQQRMVIHDTFVKNFIFFFNGSFDFSFKHGSLCNEGRFSCKCTRKLYFKRGNTFPSPFSSKPFFNFFATNFGAQREITSELFQSFKKDFLAALGGDLEAEKRLYSDKSPYRVRVPLDAMDLIKEQVKKNNPIAQTLLGILYHNGCIHDAQNRVTTPASPDFAFKLFTLSAEQGNARARSHLGVLQVNRGNIDEGILLLTQAADQNNPIARRVLGQYYFNGWKDRQGMTILPDREKGVNLLVSAADQNDLIAQRLLRKCYFNGWTNNQGTKILPAPENGVKWLTLAANQGDSVAQTTLGEISCDGWTNKRGMTVLPNPEKGIEFFTSAANKGNVEAQFLLGTMHINGWKKQGGTKVLRDIEGP